MHSIAFEFSPQVCVTGGAGYIGSHTCLEMLQEGYEVVVLDSLYNATREALKRVEELTGKTVTFVQLDIGDAAGLDKLFTETKFDAVIHFAGLKAVGESVAKPLFYYENNIGGTVNLLKAMAKGDCKSIVFLLGHRLWRSRLCRCRGFPISATNPYAARRAAFVAAAAPRFCHCGKLERVFLVVLCTFRVLRHQSRHAPSLLARRHRRSYGRTALHRRNPARRAARQQLERHPAALLQPGGRAQVGKIGEDPKGIPNNLMPYIQQVAVGRREHLSSRVTTLQDGTGVRDYIHVVDLAKGHLAAQKIVTKPGCATYNLGTGTGYSVLDMVRRLALQPSSAVDPNTARLKRLFGSAPTSPQTPPSLLTSPTPSSRPPSLCGSSKRSRRRAARSCRIRWLTADPATWPSSTARPTRPRRSWGGWPSLPWKICAQTRGVGSRTTPTGLVMRSEAAPARLALRDCWRVAL